MNIKFICYLYCFILYLNLITCEDTEMLMEIINNCRIYIQASTIGNGADQARKRLNSELDACFPDTRRSFDGLRMAPYSCEYGIRDRA